MLKAIIPFTFRPFPFRPFIFRPFTFILYLCARFLRIIIH